MRPRDLDDVPPGGRPPVLAPFTPVQVELLNTYQRLGIVHPFTCAARLLHQQDEGILVADTDGWHCPVEDCRYTQNWAHWFMADGDFIERLLSSQAEWRALFFKGQAQ